LLTFEQKYQAIGTQDTRFEGQFITAVKTTGIFCRPSCRARKPKAQNVIFYDNVRQALQHGFRPCKVCKPMSSLDETPEYIQKLIGNLQQNPYLRIKDQHLRERGIEPASLRRWFKKHHNLTFHGYQRMLRINAAFNAIMAGESVTTSAFNHGYDSLSGFNESYRTIFGSSPKGAADKVVINIVRFSSPLGPMFACATANGVCLLEFTDRRMLETEFKDLCKRLNAVILPGENPHLEQLQSELKEYFAGQRHHFELALDTPGTEFQQQVWHGLQAIPYGQTRSYKQQAAAINNPKAVRAVAQANGCNRVAIIIPCHRVIGADGSLTGYGGGLERKQWLLELEQGQQ
jgi:AraC family transcriptional regulator of adaptative response/methylated-DNA-[protein]-cysteine methyltransferase